MDEERIGKRINTSPIDEALTTPDTISTGCLYRLATPGDAVAAKKASGDAKDSLEVVDAAELLAVGGHPVLVPAAAPTRAARPAWRQRRGR